MEIRMSHVGRMLLRSLHLLLVLAVISVHRVEAQPSRADTVRFLEQSTFGPTSSWSRMCRISALRLFSLNSSRRR